jgi:hypothetical protein
MTLISDLAAAAQPPMLNKWGPEPEPKPNRERRSRLSPAALEAPITAPRSPEAALAAIKAGHPDVNLPRHILNSIKVAAYAPGCTPSARAYRHEVAAATPHERLKRLVGNELANVESDADAIHAELAQRMSAVNGNGHDHGAADVHVAAE